MSIATVVTRGYGNGTLSGSISGVVLRGYSANVLTPGVGTSDIPLIWSFLDNMANVVPLTTDAVTSTGTLTITKSPSKLGGFDLTCDGTNAGTLIIRDKNASGRILVKTSSIVGKTGFAPIPCSGTIYYSVSGTGASAFIYEWYD